MSPARAISVDMDGTLYGIHRLRAFWRLRWARGLLVALLAAREKIRQEPPLPDVAAVQEREAELVAPSFNLSIEEARLRLKELHAVLPASLTKGFEPYRGVRSALLTAHAHGLKLAILSDYDPDEKLWHLGLEDLPWSVVMATEHCGALKPHPRSFARIAQLLELEPKEVVHVGDSEELDIRGALSAGLRAWRFAPGGEVASAAERVFSHWKKSLFLPLYPTGEH